MKIQHTFFNIHNNISPLVIYGITPRINFETFYDIWLFNLDKTTFWKSISSYRIFFLFLMNMSKSFTSHMKILKIEINKNYKRFLITISKFFITVLFEFLTTYNIKIIIWDKHMTWISFCNNYFWVNILASLDKSSYLSWNRGIFWFKIRKVAAKCPRFCSLKLPCVQNKEIE